VSAATRPSGRRGGSDRRRRWRLPPDGPTAAAAEDGNPLAPLGARCRPVGI